VLGNACSWCGSTTDLEFDCIRPQGDKHHKVGSAARVCFYRKQHFEFGNLQLLCRACHELKTSRDLAGQLQVVPSPPFVPTGGT